MSTASATDVFVATVLAADKRAVLVLRMAADVLVLQAPTLPVYALQDNSQLYVARVASDTVVLRQADDVMYVTASNDGINIAA
jgi:hypothetical protein